MKIKNGGGRESLKNINAHDISVIKLHDAVLWKNDHLLTAMVEQEWDINNREEKHGDTPLHVAVLVKSAKLVKKLVSLGANVNSVDVDGKSPLHLAAASGELGIAEILLNHNCDTSIIDRNSNTPLCTAIPNNKVDMVQFLLSRGATVGNNINEALTYAMEQNWTAMLEILSDVNSDIYIQILMLS